MRKTNKSILLIMMFLFTSFAVIQNSSANFSVYVTVTDAYYADLSGDGLEMDVGIHLFLEIYNNKVSTDVSLYIGIELPSGLTFWFLVEFTAIKYTYYGYTNIFFEGLNTALESGWYNAYAVAFAEGEQYSVMHIYTFDPPGGSSPGEPVGRATFY
jgi:hypothetical protein